MCFWVFWVCHYTDGKKKVLEFFLRDFIFLLGSILNFFFFSLLVR